MAEPTQAEGTATPSAADQVTNQARSDRAALLAELEALPPETEDVKPDETPAPEGEADTPAKEPEQKAAEPEAKPEPEKKADAEDDAPDPVLAKRLDAITKAEKRAKDAVAREREAFDRERAEWKPQLDQFNQLRARAAVNPVAVLQALGVQDFEYVSRQAWSATEAARKDPKWKESATAQMRERERDGFQEQVIQELNALKAEREQERIAQQVNAYIDGVAKAVSDETPLVKSMLTKNPDGARERFRSVTESLLEATGEVPSHADVAKELEKRCRADLEDAGVDLSSVLKPKTKAPAAGETKTAKTLTNDLGTTTTPKPIAKTRAEEKADVLRELENL